MTRALMLCLLLAGCAAAPTVIEEPMEVKVPVAVPCQMPEIPEPEWPLAKVPEMASDFEWYRAALAELALRVGYEVRLRAVAAACR